MKTAYSQLPIDHQRALMSEYDKQCKENSNFSHNDQIYTPEHTNMECNDHLLNTKESLKSIQQKVCANKLCKHFTVPKQKQTHIQIQVQTLCLKCQDQFKKQSFCIYCKQIYFDNTDDGKEWIMCEECQKWVHTQCADVNIRQNPNAYFKCIKCKVIPNQSGRRYNPRNGYAKIQKKKNNDFLSSIGFQFQLTPIQIAQDMENIRQYLSFK